MRCGHYFKAVQVPGEGTSSLCSGPPIPYILIPCKWLLLSSPKPLSPALQEFPTCHILLGPLQRSSLMVTVRILSGLLQPSPWTLLTSPCALSWLLVLFPYTRWRAPRGQCLSLLSPTFSPCTISLMFLISITLSVQLIPTSVSQTPASLYHPRLIYMCLRKSST